MPHTADYSPFLLAEYAQLRGEILKRSEMQHQLISIALVALAALTSVGLKESPSALLAYPMLAVFLSASWAYNDIQIAQLGIYIRTRIECQLTGSGMGWEHAILSDRASKRIGSLAQVATRGILWGSECLAIGLYLLKRFSGGVPMHSAELRGEAVLLVSSISALVLTIVFMRNQDPLVKEIARFMERTGSPNGPHQQR